MKTGWKTACRQRLWRWRPVGIGLLIVAGAVLAADRLFPLPARGADAGLVVLADDGTPLRAWPSRDGVWRYPVSPDEVSPYYLEALLGYEDRWFRWHPGVNPASLGRAAWQWIANGRVVSGGSTLTMQVARLIDPALRQPGARRVPDKLRQIARALQLELHYSKDQILALYLAHAPMGGIVEGVEMASRSYLGKSSVELSRAEAALLAALPQAPSRLRPDRAPDAARQARDKVLQRLADLSIWSQAEVDDARIETIAALPIRARWVAPLAAERMRRSGARDPASGLARTTLQPEIQTTVERMLLDRVDALPPRVSMAVLVMENDSMAVRGYAGSADFDDPKRFSHVDMVQAIRSPGSTLKPFLYGIALEQGLIHGESLLVDAPQSFDGYRPGNFQASFTGPVSVSEALQQSLNVPAVDLLDRIGPAYFASTLRAGGIRLRMPGGAVPNLSLILGGSGTTLEELVGAYRALARGGMAGVPRLTDDAPRAEHRLLSPGAAFIVRDMLESGREAPSGSTRVAWKTGTSFGFRDAWAIGVTDDWTIGVWVGRPDGTPNPGFFGANVAAPLLHDLVWALPAGAPRHRDRPANVERTEICWPLGFPLAQTPPEQCAVRRSAWTLDGAVPPTLPDRDDPGPARQIVWVDPISGLRTRPGCSVTGDAVEMARWPTRLGPWQATRPFISLPPSWHPDCAPAGGSGALRITGLQDGATLQTVPGARDLQVRVDVLGTSGPVWWLLDGQALSEAPEAGASKQLRFTSSGLHSLTVMDEGGRFDRRTFRVLAATP